MDLAKLIYSRKAVLFERDWNMSHTNYGQFDCLLMAWHFIFLYPSVRDLLPFLLRTFGYPVLGLPV